MLWHRVLPVHGSPEHANDFLITFQYYWMSWWIVTETPSQVEWLIDGGRVPFQLFSFGGWWAAYSGQLADRYVICHGNDPLPGDLTLSTVREIGVYASGLDVPFDLAVLQSPDQVARRVSHRVDLSLHTDYERLLETI